MGLLIEFIGISMCLVYVYREAGPATTFLLGYLAIRAIGMIIRLGKMGDIIENIRENSHFHGPGK